MIASYAKYVPQRFWGLMFQSPKALWIPHCKQVHTFFMRFTIDVYFVDQQGVVVHCCQRINPYRTSPYMKHAFGVLEVPSDWGISYQIGEALNAPWKTESTSRKPLDLLHQIIQSLTPCWSLFKQHEKQQEKNTKER